MLQSPLMVTGLTSPIVDLNIHFNITHVYAADLVGVLISPAGARVTLFSRIGGSGSNFVETILDDEAEIEAAQWKTPFTGSFRPMEALSAFDGQDGNGEWIFEVSDVDFLVDGGLVNWSLEISTLDSPGEPWTRSDAQGHYQFSQLPAGDYPVRQHLPEDWSQTFPVDNEAQWAIVDQNDVAGMDFGNRQQGASPTVLAVEFNTDLLNPPNLPSGQQPTNWQLQHSDLRSIIVTFSTAVNVTPDDLRLTNLGVDAPLEDDELIMLTENHLQVSGRRLTLSFGSYELPDGVYSLEILPTVTDLTGLPLDGNGDGTAGDAYSLVGDENNGFYKIAADYNGDRGVSVFDFPSLSYWFGTPVGPTGAPQYMDLNDDQGVSIFDFGRFASNFGVGVRFPAGLQSAALIQSPPPPDGFLGGEKAPDGKQDRWPSETRVARSVGAEAFQQRVFRQRGELLQEDAWRPGPSSANWLGVRAEAVDALLTGADSEILRFLSPWPGLF
jgi:subtilisin-like proprotein convertase family protein